jgi:hypothetical protein
LQTDLGRWHLDEACLIVGRRFEKMLNNGEDPFAEGPKTYRSPKGRKFKKVKIKADGTW